MRGLSGLSVRLPTCAPMPAVSFNYGLQPKIEPELPLFIQLSHVTGGAAYARSPEPTSVPGQYTRRKNFGSESTRFERQTKPENSKSRTARRKRDEICARSASPPLPPPP